MALNRRHDLSNFAQGQERGRASAEVERLDGFFRPKLPTVHFYFGNQLLGKGGKVVARGGEVEVAVHAPLRAEGDMNVNANRLPWFRLLEN